MVHFLQHDPVHIVPDSWPPSYLSNGLTNDIFDSRLPTGSVYFPLFIRVVFVDIVGLPSHSGILTFKYNNLTSYTPVHTLFTPISLFIYHLGRFGTFGITSQIRNGFSVTSRWFTIFLPSQSQPKCKIFWQRQIKLLN